jgi:hypothetical protein
VLLGQTRGYTRHPQLARFQASPSPQEAMAAYLRAVRAEALGRGYSFDGAKIVAADASPLLAVSQGQLEYEWAHLTAKLRLRAPSWLSGLPPMACPRPHPLFVMVPGPVAAWEVVRAAIPLNP